MSFASLLTFFEASSLDDHLYLVMESSTTGEFFEIFFRRQASSGRGQKLRHWTIAPVREGLAAVLTGGNAADPNGEQDSASRGYRICTDAHGLAKTMLLLGLSPEVLEEEISSALLLQAAYTSLFRREVEQRLGTIRLRAAEQSIETFSEALMNCVSATLTTTVDLKPEEVARDTSRPEESVLRPPLRLVSTPEQSSFLIENQKEAPEKI